MSMVSVKNLNKFYNKNKPNELHVLKDLDLSVEPKEMVAIMGASGSGKSTLLNILGCVDDFQSGKYMFEDAFVSTLDDKQLSDIRCRKIGFVFQDFVLIEEETALENVKTPLFFDGSCSFRNMKRMALNALDSMKIADMANKKVSQLSGGQQQRVAIARAIVNSPLLLLADEPTGSVDSATSLEIMEVLRELNRQGMTIVIVTHDINVAEQCQRILEIVDGKIKYPAPKAAYDVGNQI